MNIPKTQLRSSKRRAAGVTLIEVLVTLVIISVGLLGVAALQLTTVRNNYDSFVRTQAAMLASDMMDRMRANRIMINQYAIELDEEDVPDNVAGNDIATWRATLAKQLPRGTGSIEVVDANARLVTVTIQWRERTEETESREDIDERVLEFRATSRI